MAARDLRQPTARVPFGRKWLAAVEAMKLTADLPLWAEATRPSDDPILFRVDTGAQLSLVSLGVATRRGWPVPPPEDAVDLRMDTPGGVGPALVRPGRVRVWWTRDRVGYPFDWPVLFVPGLPTTVPPLLGLGGVVTTCRWTFDGRPTPAAPFGGLTLDDTR